MDQERSRRARFGTQYSQHYLRDQAIKTHFVFMRSGRNVFDIGRAPAPITTSMLANTPVA